MARTGQNFSMYSGNSKTIYVNIKDAVGGIVPLTGATLKWVMKQRGKTVATKETGNGISIVDADKGRVAIKLLPEDTHNISGDCQHELKLVDADSMESTVTVGTISITASLIS